MNPVVPLAVKGIGLETNLRKLFVAHLDLWFSETRSVSARPQDHRVPVDHAPREMS